MGITGSLKRSDKTPKGRPITAQGKAKRHPGRRALMPFHFRHDATGLAPALGLIIVTVT